MLWIVGRPNGISCRPGGCRGSDFFDYVESSGSILNSRIPV
jgi:hypothetical protein